MNRRTMMVLAVLLCGMATVLNAQQPEICSTMDVEHRLKQLDPNYESRREQIEAFTQAYIQRQGNGGMRSTEPIVTIPVVVHMVYGSASQNLSDAVIQSQIDVLNEDFRRLNSDANQTRPAFAGVAADVQIEFCLANRDPQGNATNGIVRVSTNAAPFDPSFDNMKFSSQGGSNAWPASDYLNIWVCELSGNVLGFAYFPGAPASLDGVVCDYTTFGRIGSHLAFGYADGRIATHEVGHYLNLYHTFQGGCSGTSSVSCASQGDRVCDTPPVSAAHFGCPSNNPNTCTETPSDQPDQYENYMDYTYDYCKNMFSQGQAGRMQALFSIGGARSSLLNSNGCAGTIACTSGASLPVAEDFEGTFLPADWALENPDGSDTWEKRSGITGAGGATTAAAWINNYAYNAPGQEDDLITLAIDLTLNASATMTFDVAYARYSSQFSDALRIDVSSDCGNSFDQTVYSKSGATLATVSDQTSTWSPTSANHWRNETIDLTPFVGNYVAIRFTNINGYGNNLYVDNVNIAGVALPCDPPLNPNVINITNSSATLTWNDVPAANSYEVRGRPLGSTTWINLAVTGNAFNVSGIGGNVYEWQVRAVCDGGSTVSGYSELDTFGVGCQYPASHFTTNVTATTATLNWTLVPDAITYTIQGRVAGTSGWVSLGVLGAATSFPVSSLAPNTTYEWQIRTNCNIIGNSAFSPLISFTTAGPKPAGSMAFSAMAMPHAGALEVYPNPSTDHVMVRASNLVFNRAHLQVLNALGQEVYAEFVSAEQMNGHRLDVQSLTPGMYFIRLAVADEAKLVKLIVH